MLIENAGDDQAAQGAGGVEHQADSGGHLVGFGLLERDRVRRVQQDGDLSLLGLGKQGAIGFSSAKRPSRLMDI